MRRRTSLFIFIFIMPNVVIANTVTTVPSVMVVAKKNQHAITSTIKTIVTKQQIAAAGITTLSQALSELGGVQLRDISGNNNQVALSMRGFGANASSNTLILINGIPITNPDLAPPDLNAIPLHEIAFIEIIAGSESVLYGDQAVGGLINIITNKDGNDSADLSCSGGSYKQHYCFLALRKHYQKILWHTFVANNSSKNYRDHNQYKQTQLLGNLTYDYQLGQMFFDYHVAREYMQYPGALTAAQAHHDRREATNNKDYFKDWNGIYHLQHSQTLNSRWQLQTDFVTRGMNGHGVLYSAFGQSRQINFLKPQLRGTWRDIVILSGMDVQSDRYHLRSLLGLTDDHQQKYGAFVLLNTPVTEHMTMSLGVRIAKQNVHLRSFTDSRNSNRAIATTLGADVEISPSFSFYIRRAESFRFPKADENASTLPNVHGLRTQRGVAYESGTQVTSLRYVFKLGIYQLNLRDEIIFDPLQTLNAPFGTNRNLSPTQRYGLSLSGRYEILKQLTLGMQYNYIRARFQNGINANNRIPLVAENIFHANLEYNFSTSAGVYLESIFTGSQYPANDDKNVATKMGGYTLYNCNFHYDFKQFHMSFRINNLLNKYYYFYTVYQIRKNANFYYPAPGRSFILTINYKMI